jgi:hypothetical protein
MNFSPAAEPRLHLPGLAQSKAGAAAVTNELQHGPHQTSFYTLFEERFTWLGICVANPVLIDVFRRIVSNARILAADVILQAFEV